jgi:hypothetical protein
MPAQSVKYSSRRLKMLDCLTSTPTVSDICLFVIVKLSAVALKNLRPGAKILGMSRF